jgi:hypothetical protein
MTHRESHTAIFEFCGARAQATERPCAGFPDAPAKVAFAKPILVSLGTDASAPDESVTCTPSVDQLKQSHGVVDRAGRQQERLAKLAKRQFEVEGRAAGGNALH